MSETRHTVHTKKTKKFKSLTPGTMFLSCFGDLYIKVQTGFTYGTSALRVEDGYGIDFGEEADVEPIARAEYYIYEEEE